MAKLRLIIALLFISGVASGQPDTSKYYESRDYGWMQQRMYAKKVLLLPRDTTFSKYGIADKGGVVYHGNGSYWSAIGALDLNVLAPIYAVDDNTIGVDTTVLATQHYVDSVASGGGSSTTVGEGITNYGNTLRWADTLTASKNFNVVGDTYSMYTRWLSLYSGSYTSVESRAYKNDGSEYSFVGIQPAGISLQSAANSKTNYLKVQGDITIYTQDSGLLRITAPLPTALPTDSVFARGADNIIRLKAVGNGVSSVVARGDTLRYFIGGDSTYIANFGVKPDLQGALNNGSELTSDVNINANAHNFTVDSSASFALISRATYTNDAVSVMGSVDGQYFAFGYRTDSTNIAIGLDPYSGVQQSVINTSSTPFAAQTLLKVDSSLYQVDADAVRLNIPSAQPNYVLTASDTYGTATWQTLPSDVDNEPIVNAMQALGSTIKATTVGVDVSKIAAAVAFNSNTVYYMTIWIPSDTTLTGVTWFQTVQGNYTASGYNGVGLYSYSGGTWTLVASSTDDGDIWKAAKDTYGTKAFSSTYRAVKGVYAIAFTYNRSAVTTAPTIARGAGLASAAVSAIGTNSAKLYSSSSGSSFPSTIAASSQTSVNAPYFLAVY